MKCANGQSNKSDSVRSKDKQCLSHQSVHEVALNKSNAVRSKVQKVLSRVHGDRPTKNTLKDGDDGSMYLKAWNVEETWCLFHGLAFAWRRWCGWWGAAGGTGREGEGGWVERRERRRRCVCFPLLCFVLRSLFTCGSDEWSTGETPKFSHSTLCTEAPKRWEAIARVALYGWQSQQMWTNVMLWCWCRHVSRFVRRDPFCVCLWCSPLHFLLVASTSKLTIDAVVFGYDVSEKVTWES